MTWRPASEPPPQKGMYRVKRDTGTLCWSRWDGTQWMVTEEDYDLAKNTSLTSNDMSRKNAQWRDERTGRRNASSPDMRLLLGDQ